MDTILFRKWLEDNEILDQSARLFWILFREHLCADWTRGLKLSSPIKENYISLDFYDACIKIEDISTIKNINLSEYVEVRLKVSFKGGFVADFNVKFDLQGKWLSYGTTWNSSFSAVRENIIALESLKEMFEREITEEEYGIESKITFIKIIDKKISAIKNAFE